MSTQRIRLTKSAVDRLQAADRDYEVADESLPGFYVRVYANGTKTAVIRYMAGRRQRRYSIGRIHEGYTIAQARRDAETKLREVRSGQDPSLDRRRRRQAATFAEVAERYLAEHAEPRLKARTVESYRKLLDNHILPALGRMPMEDVERADVQQMHTRIGKFAKGAANRALAVVSAICTTAEAWGYRKGQSNPCRGVKRFPEFAKERFLAPEERARLEAALIAAEAAAKGHPDYVCPGSIAAIRLLSVTGARCSEITGLTWSMVDFEHRCLRLPDSKTGAKVVPLSSHAVRLLVELRGSSSAGVPWVCAGERSGRVQNLQRAWMSIRRRAELGDVRLHDLRHSLASDAAAAGVSLPIIGKILGHRSVATTQRYAHLADAVVRDALESTGRRIEENTREGSKIVSRRARL